MDGDNRISSACVYTWHVYTLPTRHPNCKKATKVFFNKKAYEEKERVVNNTKGLAVHMCIHIHALYLFSNGTVTKLQ